MLHEYTPVYCEMALDVIKNCGFSQFKFLHQQSVFEDPIKTSEEFLELDKFCSENVICFYYRIFKIVFLFQDYITLFTRCHAMLVEAMRVYMPYRLPKFWPVRCGNLCTVSLSIAMV